MDSFYNMRFESKNVYLKNFEVNLLKLAWLTWTKRRLHHFKCSCFFYVAHPRERDVRDVKYHTAHEL